MSTWFYQATIGNNTRMLKTSGVFSRLSFLKAGSCAHVEPTHKYTRAGVSFRTNNTAAWTFTLVFIIRHILSLTLPQHIGVAIAHPTLQTAYHDLISYPHAVTDHNCLERRTTENDWVDLTYRSPSSHSGTVSCVCWLLQTVQVMKINFKKKL